MALQVANQARTIGEEAEKLLKQSQQDTEQALAEISKEILTSANEIRQYLSYSEVQAMIAPYEKVVCGTRHRPVTIGNKFNNIIKTDDI